jgi:hypothetical protein
MKITIDRNVVEFVPENTAETTSMETLWRILIDCVNETKNLTPIGEFVPIKQNLARFTIEGVPGGKTVMSERRLHLSLRDLQQVHECQEGPGSTPLLR